MTAPDIVSANKIHLKRVVDDLQNEHTRFQSRLENLKARGPENGFDTETKHKVQLAYLENQLEYLELLIRRYRGWLHE